MADVVSKESDLWKWDTVLCPKCGERQTHKFEKGKTVFRGGEQTADRWPTRKWTSSKCEACGHTSRQLRGE